MADKYYFYNGFEAPKEIDLNNGSMERSELLYISSDITEEMLEQHELIKEHSDQDYNNEMFNDFSIGDKVTSTIPEFYQGLVGTIRCISSYQPEGEAIHYLVQLDKKDKQIIISSKYLKRVEPDITTSSKFNPRFH